MRLAPRWLTAAALVAAWVVAGCSVLPKETESLPPPIEPPQQAAKEVYPVRRGAVAERVRLRATVVPAREAPLSFTQAGRLRRVYVKTGDTVHQGDLLAELETGDLELSMQLADIAAQKLTLRLEQARERAQLPDGPDKTDLAMMELDLKAAQLNLAGLRSRLDAARLHAPIAGEVTAASGNAGDSVAAYQTLMTLADTSVLEIRAEADEATVTKLAAGQKAQLSFSELGDLPVAATLVQVPNLFKEPPQGRGRPVRILPDKPQPGLKMGLSGYANVILQGKPDVLLVPNVAIRNYAGRTYVVTIEGSTRREVDVTVGISGETESEIVKGLQEGQQVMGR